jgi:hypothetical protein
MKKPVLCAAAVLVAVLPVQAQQSAGYALTEHALNAGGDPWNGVALASTSYRITLDAIGDAVAGTMAASGSFQMNGGFVAAYPPPGEALGLAFSDKVTLAWTPDESAGDYNLYRDLMSDLSGLGYGDCERQDLPAASTTDTELPPAGNGYFYLVSVENRLDEEGTKGLDSAGSERLGVVCP